MAPWYAWTPWGGEFWVARFLLQRGLALTYLVAFLVAARQFRPLAGEDGLLPLSDYTERVAFREKPSLFYYLDSDRALAADAATLSLLDRDPFDGDPPRHVRALRYRYEFTDGETLRETGRWWDRERVGTYYGPVSLDDRRFRSTLRRFGWDTPEVEGAGEEERVDVKGVADEVMEE